MSRRPSPRRGQGPSGAPSTSPSRRLALRAASLFAGPALAIAGFGPALAARSASNDEGNFPAKPIQLVVPYGAGGALDVGGRILADHLSRSLGQPVVVLNRPGANANIGPAVVAQAARDGYTLLASSTATLVNPLLEQDPGWRAEMLMPVARFVQAPNLLVVPATLGLTTLTEFIAHARRHPGLATSMSGPGAPQTIATEALAQTAGIRLLDVAYKGGVSYIPDLIAGTLAVSIAPMNVVLPLVQEGKLVALATTGDRRSALLPSVPTMAESGYPEATVQSWYGLHAPAGTAAPIVAKLDAAVGKAVENPKVRERVAAFGAELAYLDTTAFIAFVESETAKAAKFVKTAAAKAR
jgi:tripartite-type tricarboxylate transporter receptor subunit TctC